MGNVKHSEPLNEYLWSILLECIGCILDSMLSCGFLILAHVLYPKYEKIQINFVNGDDFYYVFYFFQCCILSGPPMNLLGNTMANSWPYLFKQAKIYVTYRNNYNYKKGNHLMRTIMFVVMQTLFIYFGLLISIQLLVLFGEIGNKQKLFRKLITIVVGKEPDRSYNDDGYEMMRYVIISGIFQYCDRKIYMYFKQNRRKIMKNPINFMRLDGSWNHILFRCMVFHFMYMFDLIGYDKVFINGILNNPNYKLLRCIYWNRWSNCDTITVIFPFIFVFIFCILTKIRKKK